MDAVNKAPASAGAVGPQRAATAHLTAHRGGDPVGLTDPA